MGRVAPGRCTPWPRIWSIDTASTRWSIGPSRCGTSPTSRCSGPARRPTICASTTRRRRRSKPSMSGCSSAVPRPRPAEWIEALTAHAERDGVPLDFVTSHTYGNMPLDARPPLRPARIRRRPDLVDGVGRRLDPLRRDPRQRHRCAVLLSGYQTCRAGWTRWPTGSSATTSRSSGARRELFHNGFGLLTVGNLRKPRYWAVHLAAHLGDQVLASGLSGDGAEVLVRCWATKHDDGTSTCWSGTARSTAR